MKILIINNNTNSAIDNFRLPTDELSIALLCKSVVFDSKSYFIISSELVAYSASNDEETYVKLFVEV